MALKKAKTKKSVVKKIAKREQATEKTSTKKVVKKTPAKKVAKKKVVKSKSTVNKKKKTISKKKSNSKKILIIATGDQCFWIKDGPSVGDLKELRNALISIEKEQFIHHVNNMKNDFAVWVEEILEDVACASGIRKSKTKTGMIKNIEKSLLGYRR